MSNTLCCVFVLLVFILCTLMLAVSLDCPFFISPSVFSSVYSNNIACQSNNRKKEKRQNDLQNTSQKTNNWATCTSQKTGVNSGMVSSSCTTSRTCHVTLVKYLVVSHEWGKGKIVFTTKGTDRWSFVTQIFWQRFNWVNKVIMVTVNLFKWWIQLDH